MGREEELIRMKEAFQDHGSQREVVLLCGLGGIGKTQLAVAFLKRHRDIYSAVFWLNGKNEDTLKQSKRLCNKSIFGAIENSCGGKGCRSNCRSYKTMALNKMEY